MAVNSSRSMSKSLAEGATDGKYRKVHMNMEVTPGMGEEKTEANRASLHPFYGYGFINTEYPAQVNPGA